MQSTSSNLLQSALAGEALLVFDGGMGTMLQECGLKAGELPELLCLDNPSAITDVHRAYVEAGSQIVTTNTFGANALNLGDAQTVDKVYAAAVACAREAGARYVAGDIGPIGKLMAPMGDLEFADAYDLFHGQASAAARAGADAIIIETMADLLEICAAVVAVKDACDLPIFATMTFTEIGRTFLGTTPTSAACALAALGVDALGVNCSAGPIDLQPVVFEMLKVSPVPVIVQANAGLPQVVNGEVTYTLTPDEYAADVAPMIDAGATIIGGCCGTNPDFIRAVAALVADHQPTPRPITHEQALDLARNLEGAARRDARILEAILDAPDRAALREELE